ncbi:MAG: HAD-IIIA family hydrolase [Anaerolineae bacterium]|nr:HAD-IIIA family hydrolase [Anaerolineae bacterium]
MAMLHIFDLDGTLVEKYGERPLTGVVEKIAELQAQGARIAVATNQAGPAWGAATGELKYPDPRDLGARFVRIAAHLPQLAQVPWFVSVGDDRLSLSRVAYRLLIQELEIGAAGLGLHVSAASSWRKPAPGMLLAACQRFHVGPEMAIFVGDAETDAEAAANAGMAFSTAARFFGWGQTVQV